MFNIATVDALAPIPDTDKATPQGDPYYGLLSNPPGTYGRATHGASLAFTLRGSASFLTKAQNLFDSFAGETENGPLDGSGPRYFERREVTFHQGNDKGSLYFCMPPKRYLKAVFLYLYGQLVHSKGEWKEHRDAEGSFLGQSLLNEPALELEAEQLTKSFWDHELGLDYRAIPEYTSSNGLAEHACTRGGLEDL